MAEERDYAVLQRFDAEIRFREESPDDYDGSTTAIYRQAHIALTSLTTHLRLAREVVRLAQAIEDHCSGRSGTRGGAHGAEGHRLRAEMQAALSAYRSATASMEKNDGL